MSDQPNGLTYAQAGVDIDAGNALVDAIKPLAKATRRPGAEASLGGFGALFDLKAAGYDDPLLVTTTDGVGTKLRIAIDTGMHAKKWSREQAVKYMVDTMGDEESGAITEIERYVVWPGQACSYMIGKITWLRARAKAQKALGKAFDIRAFHDAGLLSGAMPLTVLERVIDDYIVSKGGKA